LFRPAADIGADFGECPLLRDELPFLPSIIPPLETPLAPFLHLLF
jgi:hypothetical protein